jgi:hypothetical protein
LESTTWHGHDGVCGIQLVHSLLGQDELETLEDLLSYLPHFPIACSHIVVLDNKQELNLALEVSFPSPARSSIPCLLLVSKMLTLLKDSLTISLCSKFCTTNSVVGEDDALTVAIPLFVVLVALW